MFSCAFCEISKNTFFTEHLWTIKRTINHLHKTNLRGLKNFAKFTGKNPWQRLFFNIVAGRLFLERTPIFHIYIFSLFPLFICAVYGFACSSISTLNLTMKYITRTYKIVFQNWFSVTGLNSWALSFTSDKWGFFLNRRRNEKSFFVHSNI